ncbi:MULTISPECIES: ATP-binding protein [unclassified Janthinobacterium]|uniref:ATP-binding protein n=1 Tax=unclassified Janthinobacterium TaxID=2610881 RepID=UPI0016154A9D|nr:MULTISPECIES: ATP-binding protein [unclassified Janthinobacterium]MBB5368111.1 signal transduction histidine kinase/ActR/RegA family two-component response regulator [Janthinobacterium sp. K2C7]MBB5379411.1 signal transduction histidine kinase/ActR/RegA family two-component response regulator [Janthinobacterium sp. K2Li3]MBB5386493.1 signal transduction histidine kinase/ActR/RegA family two-component response regulator [Janthinobacterium sp. K2E3]
MLRLRSIRHKLMSVVLLTTLVALVISLGTIVIFDLRAYHRNLLADISTQAELLGHMSSAALAFDDQRLALENLNLMRIRPRVTAGALYRADGSLFASYQANNRTAALPARAGIEGERIDANSVELFRSIVDNGELLGTVYLRADYELAGRTADYLAIALGVTVLALLVALLLLRRLDYMITQPILDIADVAREVIETRDYSRRARKLSSDEVAQLVDSFNKMLAEIELRTHALESSNVELAREAGQRAQAQQEIMRLNQQLEVRVHERTMQLELTNGELAMAMEEARSANYAKSAFLSSMSHELRTPLNAILGFAQILSSDRLPSTLAQKKEFAGHILKSGRHLLTLINEILDLAKVESGTVTLSLEPVALHAILDECRDMIAPLASQRGIAMTFPDASPLTVLADRTRLKQILLNLLSNALKYNREHGRVSVDCEWDGEGQAGGRVRISVHDTGSGLTDEQLAQLFQPFNRLGQEGGTEEGSGIGLVVTKRLVDLMDGSIGVTSEPGEGSTFWIELRAVDALPGPSSSSVPPDLAGALFDNSGPVTVLYVEDNPANLALIEEIIGYCPRLRLLTARDGRQGVEMARTHMPQLILMDINLPDVSGTEALQLLRDDDRTAHIPVIALTANAMPGEVERSMALGFYRYLTKPINLEEFSETINSALAYVARQRQQKGGRAP